MASLMGFGSFGDKKGQLKQLKRDLEFKKELQATRRDRKYALCKTSMSYSHACVCVPVTARPEVPRTTAMR